MNKPHPKSICILRLSAIGDVCHALSTVQLIQRTFPNTQITWIMGKVEAQLLGDLPGVNVVVFDKSLGLKGMQSVWKQLSNRRFDYLLHMQVALRASVLTLGIKAKVKLGFSWKRAKEGQWLFTNKKLPATHAEHVLDNFNQFAQYLGCPDAEPSWQIPTLPADELILNPLPQRYIVISPAASKDERNWLVESYAEVADYAVERGVGVVLCGAPTEREQILAKAIQSKAKNDLVNLVGQTTLKQLCVVLRNAQCVIAPDSGPAHIATTQGTPVIGLYAHSNPKRTGPYNALETVVSVYEDVVNEQFGKPAKDLKWGTRVKGSDLMARIPTERVKQVLQRFI
ncbi:glycosyltransferase family 9 protein [Vibrio astriarenae]|uniref:glycosyltransferase family 9 protein n=1 Tax=Vibrio astriarenae TaxID=1481923 RepID=UPI003B83363C